MSKTGNRRGGKSFGRGALYHLLSNPVYVGEIRHKDERHPGQHEALISRELWERVQIQLRSKPGRKSETRETEAPRSPLTARLFDENGEPLYVQGCAKGRRRYRYYVSKGLVKGRSRATRHGWRLSAPDLSKLSPLSPRHCSADQKSLLPRPNTPISIKVAFHRC